MNHDEHESQRTPESISRHQVNRRKVIHGAAVVGIGALTAGAWEWSKQPSPLLADAASATSYNYVFTTFIGRVATTQQKLFVYTSVDGLNFSLLSNTGYSGPGGVLRDPSIMLHTDGKFYIAYTPHAWTSSNNSFGIASSSDLIHWTYFTSVTSTIPNTQHVWAPEWFKDTDGSINILVAIDDSGNGTNFRIFKYTATNSSLTTWSSPTVVIGAGNYIDPFIVKLGSVYHIFAKGPTYIETATATHLAGPWKWRTGNWAGWGSDKEGPALFQLLNGDWRAILDYDLGGAKQFVYSDSSDGLSTWTAPKDFPGISGTVRHGTVFKVSSGPFNSTLHYKLVNRNSGKALDITNQSTANGAVVDQSTYNGSTSQQWRIIIPGGVDSYTLIDVKSGRLLDGSGEATGNGAQVIQWTSNGSTSQQWKPVLVSAGYYKLVNVKSGKVLEVSSASTADGAQITQGTDDGSTNQQWSIVQVS